MSTAEVRIEPSVLNERTDWTEHEVTAALAGQLSDGVAGRSHQVGFWCPA